MTTCIKTLMLNKLLLHSTVLSKLNFFFIIQIKLSIGDYRRASSCSLVHEPEIRIRALSPHYRYCFTPRWIMAGFLLEKRSKNYRSEQPRPLTTGCRVDMRKRHWMICCCWRLSFGFSAIPHSYFHLPYPLSFPTSSDLFIQSLA